MEPTESSSSTERLRRAVHRVPPLHRTGVAVIQSFGWFFVHTHVKELWVSGRLKWLQAIGSNRLQPEVRRFLVFGQGRSGSSLLLDLLRSHPEVYCEAEIFHPKVSDRLLAPWRYINARAALSKKPVYGCQLKIYQMTEDQGIIDPGGFLSDLHEAGWMIVYLVREDLFKKALSLTVAEARGQFLDRKGDSSPELGMLRIEPDALLRAMRERGRFGTLEIEALGDLPHVKVVYEDDLLPADRHQPISDEIFHALGLESAPVQTELVRTSRAGASDYIENYQELVAAVRESELAEHAPPD
jgi:LPS sulfotransferase NodH